MSDTEHSNPTDGDYSPAIPLEISAEKAQEVDSILQKIAETAELETALVVHSSGCLVSGISSEADVTVEVISALVASASGALNALIRELGEAGKLESLHQGEERSVYFKALPRDFVLVGVSAAAIPVGQIREAARQNTEALLSVLENLPDPEIVSVSEVPVPRKSLRPKPGSVEEAELAPDSSTDEETSEMALEQELEDKAAPGIETESEVEVEPEVEKEPTEIIEVIGGDDPEIVIDGVESPFEVEDPEAGDEEEKNGEESDLVDVGSVVTESIFEVEEEPTEEKEVAASIFEEDTEEEEEESPAPTPGNIFEVDDEEESETVEADGDAEEGAPFELDPDDEGAEMTSAFELDEGEDEDEEGDTESSIASGEEPEEADASGAESEEDEPEAIEEEEVRSSGPFYF